LTCWQKIDPKPYDNFMHTENSKKLVMWAAQGPLWDSPGRAVFLVKEL